MKLAQSMTVVAGFAAIACAQNTITYSWTVGDTGNNDGVIEPGESALLNMYATVAPAKTGFAGSIYDITGGANWATGTVTSYVNGLKALTDDGTLQANGDITGIEIFQLPPLFNPLFDASNPIKLYSITWTPADYAARSVSVGDTNHLNNDIYIDNFGSSVSYTGVTGSATFNVVPAPSALALLGLGGLAAGRRRR